MNEVTGQEQNGPQEKPRDLAVLDAILATQPTLYVNVSGRPMMEIPLGAAPQAREAWPLDSPRAQAEISLFAYHLDDPIVLRDREVSQIIRVLTVERIAWRCPQLAETGRLAADDVRSRIVPYVEVPLPNLRQFDSLLSHGGEDYGRDAAVVAL